MDRRHRQTPQAAMSTERTPFVRAEAGEFDAPSEVDRLRARVAELEAAVGDPGFWGRAAARNGQRVAELEEALRVALKAMEEQEPVAWMNDQEKRDDAFIFHTPSEPANPFFPIPLYTHPAPSAAVELSEQDIERMVTETVPGFAIGFAKELVSHIAKHYTIYPKQPAI